MNIWSIQLAVSMVILVLRLMTFENPYDVHKSTNLSAKLFLSKRFILLSVNSFVKCVHENIECLCICEPWAAGGPVEIN